MDKKSQVKLDDKVFGRLDWRVAVEQTNWKAGGCGDSGIHFGHVVFVMHIDIQEEVKNKDLGWGYKFRS